MGTAMTPATESIMGSLPLDRAGVGSAMNDTTRQVGGALGVAVIGSLLASFYSSSLTTAMHGLPSRALAIADNSVGAAIAVAHGMGGAAGAALSRAADRAFVHGMDSAVLAAAGVAFLGSLVSLVFLPSRPPDFERQLEHDSRSPVEAVEPEPVG
jgi:hypothetical protein